MCDLASAQEFQESVAAIESYNEYETTFRAAEKYAIKLRVDAWLVKYDKWLTRTARIAERKLNIRNIWEDLKSEAILEAYRIGERFNSELGHTLEKFLINSLWLFCLKSNIVGKYCRNRRVLGGSFVSKWNAEGKIRCNGQIEEPEAKDRGNPSLIEAENVFSLLEQLPDHERQFVELKYKFDISSSEADRVTDVGGGVTQYRVNRVIGKIRVRGDSPRDC